MCEWIYFIVLKEVHYDVVVIFRELGKIFLISKEFRNTF